MFVTIIPNTSLVKKIQVELRERESAAAAAVATATNDSASASALRERLASLESKLSERERQLEVDAARVAEATSRATAMMADAASMMSAAGKNSVMRIIRIVGWHSLCDINRRPFYFWSMQPQRQHAVLLHKRYRAQPSAYPLPSQQLRLHLHGTLRQ